MKSSVVTTTKDELKVEGERCTIPLTEFLFDFIFLVHLEWVK